MLIAQNRLAAYPSLSQTVGHIASSDEGARMSRRLAELSVHPTVADGRLVKRKPTHGAIGVVSES